MYRAMQLKGVYYEEKRVIVSSQPDISRVYGDGRMFCSGRDKGAGGTG